MLCFTHAIYRFEACDSGSDGHHEYSGESGYYDGSSRNDNYESGYLENSTAASDGDNSAGDDDYFGGIKHS